MSVAERTGASTAPSTTTTSGPQIDQAWTIGGTPFTGLQELNFAKDSKEKEKAFHTRQDHRDILDNETAWAKEIRDDSNTDAVRTAMDKWWQNNHAMNNYRGNLNGKSFEQTLNLSRAADALNNSRHWDPGTTGRTTNSKFGSQAAQMGKSERWEPIETQEMRQMRQNEEIERGVRERDVKRQGDVQDYALDLQKKTDDARYAMSAALNMSDKDVEQALRQAAIAVNVNLPAQTRASQMITNFTERLKQLVQTENGNYIISVFNKCGSVAAGILAQMFGASAPGEITAMQQQAMRQLWTATGGDPMQTNFAYNTVMGLWGMSTGQAMMGGLG